MIQEIKPLHKNDDGDSQPTFFYRFYKKNKYATDEEVTDLCGTVMLQEFRLVRATPKGYWIKPTTWSVFSSSEVWVSATGRKRHAYPTKKEALASFLARSKSRHGLLKREMILVEQALQYAAENEEKLLRF